MKKDVFREMNGWAGLKKQVSSREFITISGTGMSLSVSNAKAIPDQRLLSEIVAKQSRFPLFHVDIQQRNDYSLSDLSIIERSPLKYKWEGERWLVAE